MLRSMYSGISGMRNFQTKLDVIGNNIANVNTFGFKKGRVTFKDMVSQTIAGAASPDTLGGQNAKQVGLGSTLSTIDTITTQGSLQTTGRPLDLAISGDGYFVVSDGTNEYFTRAGNFYLDEDGNLVNSDGFFVLNTEGDTITIDSETYESFSISPTGMITKVEPDGTVDTNDTIGIAKFANPDGLMKAGNNLFQQSNNSGSPVAGSGTDDYLTPGDNCGSLVPGSLEMSNVDLSEEFTEMIVAQRGFQANTRIITTSDEILQELVNLKR